jgi:hypothetical protein
LKEYCLANAIGGVEASPIGVVESLSWNPPPQEVYKVNWDAAIDSINKCMGVSAIVRDYQGIVIAARSYTLGFISKPVVAEAIAALHVVEFSRDLGIPHLILEGDSLQVVNAVQDIDTIGAVMDILLLIFVQSSRVSEAGRFVMLRGLII